LQEEFLSSFYAFVFDSRIPKSSRPAALGAILNALFIGLSSGDPERRDKLILDTKRAQAAMARAAREEKSAPQREATRAAIRAAMRGTKPKLSEEYAKLIQPKVIQLLGRNVSPSQIRGHVRVFIEEAPGKSGKS
jgi:hypothetical protein